MLKFNENTHTAGIREKYACYKIADLAVKLYLCGIDKDDIAYIMQGGENVKMTPYPKLQAWLAQAMDRMEEKIPAEKAEEIRQDSACCLSGVREQLAKSIYKNNPDIESRFEAFSKERRIIGGKAWREDDGYYVSYWYDKPETGYSCGCLRCVPEKPMNKLWCACCAGHIKHHFQIALGVKAECHCITSVLSSAGEDACVFRLNIISETDHGDFTEALSKSSPAVNEIFNNVCDIIKASADGKAELKLWSKLPSFYIGEAFVRVIPFKDHINIEASAVSAHKDELKDYKITPKGMLQIYEKQPICTDIIEKIVKETLF